MNELLENDTSLWFLFVTCSWPPDLRSNLICSAIHFAEWRTLFCTESLKDRTWYLSKTDKRPSSCTSFLQFIKKLFSLQAKFKCGGKFFWKYSFYHDSMIKSKWECKWTNGSAWACSGEIHLVFKNLWYLPCLVGILGKLIF